MEVLESKPVVSYKDELKRLIKLLTYKQNKLELKGSASLTSQKYFSDYDLFSVVERPDKDELYDFFVKLLVKIGETEDLWFIELKLQTKQGRKVRVYPKCELKKADWDKVWKSLDFIKIDLIARIDGFFTEVSCIYSISETLPTQKDYTESLQQDIKDLTKEKKWYKILKRNFNIAKAEDNKSELVRLSKIFNSELGKEYQLISRLEALDTVLEHYQEPELIKKASISLKDLHLPDNIARIEDWVKTKSNALNAEAKKLIPSHRPHQSPSS